MRCWGNDPKRFFFGVYVCVCLSHVTLKMNFLSWQHKFNRLGLGRNKHLLALMHM